MVTAVVRAEQGLADLTAVILAGGQGTRLRPVVADRSKVMAEVSGRPFLALLMDHLAAFGLRRVVLCTGHMADGITRTFGARYHGLDVLYSHEYSPLGTGGALRLALPLCTSETILALNGDSFCEADLAAFWDDFSDHALPGALLLTHVPDTRRYGRIQLGPDHRIATFEEKGVADGPGWINAGVYLFTRDLLVPIESGRNVSLEKELLPHWIRRGLRGFCGGRRFLDIGTPEAYAAAQGFFGGTGAP